MIHVSQLPESFQEEVEEHVFLTHYSSEIGKPQELWIVFRGSEHYFYNISIQELVQFPLLGQWLNFKLFGITYLVGKISRSNFYFRVQDGWVSSQDSGFFGQVFALHGFHLLSSRNSAEFFKDFGEKKHPQIRNKTLYKVGPYQLQMGL